MDAIGIIKPVLQKRFTVEADAREKAKAASAATGGISSPSFDLSKLSLQDGAKQNPGLSTTTPSSNWWQTVAQQQHQLKQYGSGSSSLGSESSLSSSPKTFGGDHGDKVRYFHILNCI
jgi:hypothetical protein